MWLICCQVALWWWRMVSLHEDIYPSFLQFKVLTDGQCINVGCCRTTTHSSGAEFLSAAFQKSSVKCFQMQQPMAASVKFHTGWKILPCCIMNSWWRVSCMWTTCPVFSFHSFLSLRLRLKGLQITKAISSAKSWTPIQMPPLVRLKPWKPLNFLYL